MRWLVHIWDRTSFYLDNKGYATGYAIAVLYVLSFFAPVLQTIATYLLVSLCVLVVIDAWMLYRHHGLSAKRVLAERFSNGDENKVVLTFYNAYSFPISIQVIEELPFQFGDQNNSHFLSVPGQGSHEICYSLVPKSRGEYHFGKINVFVEGPLGLVKRRYRLGKQESVKVFPSFVQLRYYQWAASGGYLRQQGVKRMRKLGHSLEFEQIKEYVRGDDYRTLNWKATARRGQLMANSYTDEKSQQVYCLVDKGRAMRMPFEGMTLLDYAINASLVFSGVALQKGDKAGLVTFGTGIDAFIPAAKKAQQISILSEALYRQQTAFLEPDYEAVFSLVRKQIPQRSLLVLFTNFETRESMERVFPFLKTLARYYLLMVVIFENTELQSLTETRAESTEDIYIQTIAQKYKHEKSVVIRELRKWGIIGISSAPQQLSVKTLNKYLELKTRTSI